MKNKYSIKYLCFLVFLISTFSITTANAQITFPDDVDDETPAAPIDGFVGLGIAAGIYFGVRKRAKHKD
ncbi:PID-CTERM protein-sorting domain-containing protein [Dokdonia ponticola]|uniref:PID-CTERM protein-sorting domain-containing protein n=1 Tax=Dokdonia ponticola TaxID=2041041 RepID=A0ABV9HTB5_9FLAO